MVYIALQRKEIAVGDLYTDQTKDVLFFKLHMSRLSKKKVTHFYFSFVIQLSQECRNMASYIGSKGTCNKINMHSSQKQLKPHALYS